MEKLVRRSEEETYLWTPFQFLDQTVIAIFKCLGLLCSTAKKTASSPVTLNQPVSFLYQYFRISKIILEYFGSILFNNFGLLSKFFSKDLYFEFKNDIHVN